MFNDDIVFSVYRQGASHKPEGKPCQDFASHYCDSQLQIITLSDGHGGDKYLRSQYGSEIASVITLEALKEFCKGCNPDDLLPDGEESASRGPVSGDEPACDRREQMMNHLFQHICSKWHRLIRDHYSNSPFTDEERSFLKSIKATDYYFDLEGKIIDRHLPSAYGCTLIAVAATPDYWIGFQIGDGKCVIFNDNGTWEEPIPWDKNCFQNLTTSLSKNDFDSFRYSIRRNLPVVTFIASDGMDDSYQPMEALADCYGNYMLWPLFKMGVEQFQNKLGDLLDRISTIGSKDDMSVGYIVDMQRLPGMLEHYMRDSRQKLNERIAHLSDEIGELNKNYSHNEEDIISRKNIIREGEKKRNSIIKDVKGLVIRSEEIESQRPRPNCVMQALMLAFDWVKEQFNQKNKEIDEQLVECKKLGDELIKQNIKNEKYISEATTEIGNLKNQNSSIENKIKRLQREYNEISAERDTISQRLESLNNEQEG